jgi:hypothetical protein
MATRNPQTQAKRARELAVREKRERKKAKKAENAANRAAGIVPEWLLDESETAAGDDDDEQSDATEPLAGDAA